MADYASRPSAALTAVELEQRPGVRQVRLIFGIPAHAIDPEQSRGITRRTLYFRAGAVFAIELWQGASIANRGRQGRVRTRYQACYVVQACQPGDTLTRVPQIIPGARVLIKTEGVRRCKFVLAWIEELVRRCDPCVLPAEFYEIKSLRVQGLVPERARPAAIGFPNHALAR